jgi:hypothetical protein
LDLQCVDKAKAGRGHANANLACIATRAGILPDLKGLYGREFLNDNGPHPILLRVAINITTAVPLALRKEVRTVGHRAQTHHPPREAASHPPLSFDIPVSVCNVRFTS